MARSTMTHLHCSKKAVLGGWLPLRLSGHPLFNIWVSSFFSVNLISWSSTKQPIVSCSTNLVFHTRTKHIKLDYHFVHKRVKLGTHKVQFIPPLDQPVDLMTKGLSKPQFLLLRFKVISSWPSYLRGDVRKGVLSNSTVSLRIRN
ncbi:unnamed protein product [Malus baccata var. baccata]